MLRTHKFMIIAVLSTVALGACATDKDRNGSNVVPQIQSTQDLEVYLHATPDSPLNRLPADARQRFLNSLMFTERGLASFRYADLKTLSSTDVYQILSLFGVEHSTSLLPKGEIPSNFDSIEIGGVDDKWCASRASCAPMTGWTCTDNC